MSERWGDSPRDWAELDRYLTQSREEAWGLDDEDLVSVYTRAEAIADGVLRDATHVGRELGIACPCALTVDAWEALGCDDRDALRRALLAVVLTETFGYRAGDAERIELELCGVDGWVSVWATVDGDGLTVMLEGED